MRGIRWTWTWKSGTGQRLNNMEDSKLIIRQIEQVRQEIKEIHVDVVDLKVGQGKNQVILQEHMRTLSDNSVVGSNIRLVNDEYLRSRNAADDGDINILKINASDNLELGVSIESLSVVADIVSSTLAASTSISSSRVEYTPANDQPNNPQAGWTYIDSGVNRDPGLYRYTGTAWSLVDSESSDLDFRTDASVSVTLQTTDQLVKMTNAASVSFPDPSTVIGREIILISNSEATISGFGISKLNSVSPWINQDSIYVLRAIASENGVGSTEWVPLTKRLFNSTTTVDQTFRTSATGTITLPNLDQTLEAGASYRVYTGFQTQAAQARVSMSVTVEDSSGILDLGQIIPGAYHETSSTASSSVRRSACSRVFTVPSSVSGTVTIKVSLTRASLGGSFSATLNSSTINDAIYLEVEKLLENS